MEKVVLENPLRRKIWLWLFRPWTTKYCLWGAAWKQTPPEHYLAFYYLV